MINLLPFHVYFHSGRDCLSSLIFILIQKAPRLSLLLLSNYQLVGLKLKIYGLSFYRSFINMLLSIRSYDNNDDKTINGFHYLVSRAFFFIKKAVRN